MERARAMMNHAGFEYNLKKKFWCEAKSTVTKLDNIMVKHMGGKPPYCMFFRNFGEIAVVANHERKSTRTTIEQRGKTVIFVGYAVIILVMSTDSFI